MSVSAPLVMVKLPAVPNLTVDQTSPLLSWLLSAGNYTAVTLVGESGRSVS